MIVADTSAWIDYLNGVDAPHVDILDWELENDLIVIGDLIITELLQGFRDEKSYKAAKQIIGDLEYYDFCGRDIAYKAADNYRKLRKKGVTVRKNVDMLIGTFCIEQGFSLIHNDRDFDAMEECLGLAVLH